MPRHTYTHQTQLMQHFIITNYQPHLTPISKGLNYSRFIPFHLITYNYGAKSVQLKRLRVRVDFFQGLLQDSRMVQSLTEDQKRVLQDAEVLVRNQCVQVDFLPWDKFTHERCKRAVWPRTTHHTTFIMLTVFVKPLYESQNASRMKWARGL